MLRGKRTLLAALVLMAVGGAGAEETTIHIALVSSISNGAELIALDRGYFKEYGLNVVIDDINTSADTIAMLATNRLQIIAGGISAGYFNALQKNIPITIIGDPMSTSRSCASRKWGRPWPTRRSTPRC